MSRFPFNNETKPHLGWATKRVLKLIERDGNKCFWCGKECDPYAKQSKAHRATVEHLIRLADGGTGRMENLVVACRRCNNTRHSPNWKLKTT
jgi:5-methylcytosine-specific restriction endonuclease McrA